MLGPTPCDSRCGLTRFPDNLTWDHDAPREGSWMPAAKPPEFRRRAVELARRREKSIAEIAHDLGIAESCLRRWLRAGRHRRGRAEGLSTDERAELVRLRRENGCRRWRSRSSSGPVAYSVAWGPSPVEIDLLRWSTSCRDGIDVAGLVFPGCCGSAGSLLRVARPRAPVPVCRHRRAAHRHDLPRLHQASRALRRPRVCTPSAGGIPRDELRTLRGLRPLRRGRRSPRRR
jgi:transposase-like protein